MALPRMFQTTGKTSTIQTMFRIILGVSLLGTGIAHLTWGRTSFLAQVPPWLPLDGDFVVVVSGIAELALAVGLIGFGRYRVPVGWAAAAFFVIIFPGNISQYVNRTDGFGMTTDEPRAIRLLFQPVLVAWALWSTGAWQAWRDSRQVTSSPTLPSA